MPEIIARLDERCEKEVAKDANWLFANGGFAGLPLQGLSLAQISGILDVVNFGPCDMFYQRWYNATIHSAWRRVYLCGGQVYSG